MLPSFKQRHLLLVCVALQALCVGFAARTAYYAAIQREAVFRVRQTHGSVKYDSSVPQWCVDLFGIDFFATATSVSYFEWGVPIDVPENRRNYFALAELTQLRELDVFDSWFPNEILPAMTSVTRLSVVRHTLTDVDVRKIARLKQLQVLVLCENHITDAGAASLSELTNLTKLDLSGNFVTNEAVNGLRTALPTCVIENRWQRPAP